MSSAGVFFYVVGGLVCIFSSWYFIKPYWNTDFSIFVIIVVSAVFYIAVTQGLRFLYKKYLSD